MPKKGRRGYLFPDTIETEDRMLVIFCFPDTPEYRHALAGQLYGLAKWYNWDHDRSGKSDETGAADTASYLKPFILEAVKECR